MTIRNIDEAEEKLRNLEWSKFFIKDFVKSLKTSVGSVVEDPSQIHQVIADMRKYRGKIEGGLCIRRYEGFKPGTEVRYFVIDRKTFGLDAADNIPEVAMIASECIESPFFSIDIAERLDGVLRIVEIGDGQVSDLTGWSVERFVGVWSEAKA